jgi:hypothetical protein
LAALSRQNNGQAQKIEEAVQAAQSLHFIRMIIWALYGERPIFLRRYLFMKWTEEEKRQFILRVDIGRARRLYDEGKNAEEIAAVVRRPVALMEKWIGNFKIIDQKRQARNG